MNVKEYNVERYLELIKKLYDPILTPKEQFEASVLLAREVGVPEDEILKCRKDIDNFFLS